MRQKIIATGAGLFLAGMAAAGAYAAQDSVKAPLTVPVESTTATVTGTDTATVTDTVTDTSTPAATQTDTPTTVNTDTPTPGATDTSTPSDTDTPASGAKREPGRDLPVPRAGSRKQQRRDVQAGQQQNDDKHHQQESQPTFVRLAKTAVGAGRAWFES